MIAYPGTMEGDAEYFSRRASEESAAAIRAGDARAADVHRTMAQRYGDLAAAIQKNEQRTGVGELLRRFSG